MLIKNKITLLAFSVILTTPLLKGMSSMPDIFELKDLYQYYKNNDIYGQEKRILDLSNREITEDFLSKNQIPLQKFIEEKKIQVLDLQRNNLTTIPVYILKILLTLNSTLQEINIVSPKLGVGHRSIDFYDVSKICECIKECAPNFEILYYTENETPFDHPKIIKITENQTLYLITKQEVDKYLDSSTQQ